MIRNTFTPESNAGRSEDLERKRISIWKQRNIEKTEPLYDYRERKRS